MHMLLTPLKFKQYTLPVSISADHSTNDRKQMRFYLEDRLMGLFIQDPVTLRREWKLIHNYTTVEFATTD